ncbi:MAG: sodium-translocating pyrophosphatase [Planctomycetes bacterium]|nr:sodium-translocating pyrophosphatase [Planctomycetota bacterium]
MAEGLYYVFGFGGPALAIVWAVLLNKKINAADPGTERMQKIAGQIRTGAMAFLKTEYTYLAGFVGVVFLLLGFGLQSSDPNANSSWSTAISFAVGALASAAAGWIGMRTATEAAVRTTHAARTSLSGALTIAFSSGAVMGLTVVALGVAGITGLYIVFGQNVAAADTIFGFSLGASSIALFARVGGGIFTKAADVGADLVGKVEAGIPEDDPRNPAVIADNVGDNVGDVAGMGADLFESFVGCVISAIALAWAMGQAHESWDLGDSAWVDVRESLTMFPVILAGLGTVCSVIGTLAVKTNDESKIHSALERGLLLASVLVVGGAAGVIVTLGLPLEVLWAVISGLGAGVLIGKVTHYYTATESKPVQYIVTQSSTGPATTLIAGLGVGMISCAIPVILICGAIYLSYDFAGVYGIAIAAVGMLSTLGISLGVDAYGPVADNAGGIAEMSECEPEVRKRTDALDAVGNTTAAVGKGFAIGSAALTALALFSVFRTSAVKAAAAAGKEFDAVINLSEPTVLIGLLLGGTLPFVFSALTMNAVGRAANRMIEEVRRQFRTIPGLMEGKADPDSETCVAIATGAAIKEMIIPGLLAVIAPVVVGYALGYAGLGGLLGGALVAGVLMAIMMANAGGAWDNAKKYIEEGNAGGKGSDAHKAAVIGDTVGDPFKDTSGPSLNILVKLMSVVAVIIVPLVIKWM